MADYISRQKAIEAIMDLPNCPNGYSDTYDKECIIGTLEEVPTADVAEVIRCKECSYHELDGDGDDWCVWSGNNIKQTDFCSMGERRTDDGDGTETG